MPPETTPPEMTPPETTPPETTQPETRPRETRPRETRPDSSPYGPPVGGTEPRRPSHYTLGTRTPELALPLGLDQLPGTALPSPLPTTGPPPSPATHHGTTTVTVSRDSLLESARQDPHNNLTGPRGALLPLGSPGALTGPGGVPDSWGWSYDYLRRGLCSRRGSLILASSR
ncbi:unnamed protein product [Arctogadus glacialis]